MNKTLLALLLSGSIAFGAGCHAPDSASGIRQAAAPVYPQAAAFDDFESAYQNRTENEVSDSFLSGVRQFSADTASRLLNGSENACYSPASLYFALSLSAAGARGNTQTQLRRLLGAKDAASLTADCARLYRLLYTDNAIGTLKIANALWMTNAQNGQPVAFETAFCDTASRDFYASLYTADLTAPATRTAMANWVRDNTGGKITPEIQTDPDSLLFLMNAIYLKDEWIDRFDAAQNTVEPFHCADGTERNATFMHRTMLGGFIRGEGYTSASLGLKNCGGMTFVLPDKTTDLRSLLQADTLSEILSGGKESGRRCGHIYWMAPKFSYGTNLDLRAALQAAGVTDLFDASRADLSGATQQKPAFLAAVRQQTYSGIDENGVEAAAYTELGYASSSAMPEDEAYMTLDRPFLYILTAQNGTPLFIGVCAQI